MNQRGFNRIEVLVLMIFVVAVVFLFLNFIFDVQKSVRDSKRRGDIETIAKELEVHYNNVADQYCQDAKNNTYCAADPSWFSNNEVPVDPLTGENYLKLPQNGDKTFMICAKLEKDDGNILGNQQSVGLGANSGYYYCSNSQQ